MKKVLLIVLILAAAAIARAQNTGDPENGKKLFLADGCWQCHNYNGSGGRQGARLAQTKLTAQGLITYIRKPRTMPAYSEKVLSDKEATDIWAYIKTFPDPPPLSSIAILNNLD
jgi:mono/diheme cytochrome c family protein